MKYRAYIGTYLVRGSRGIYLTEADTETGVLEILDAWPAVNPSYLAVSEGFLFAALECDEFEGNYGGGAASYTINADGSLTLLSARPTRGKSPCHVCPGPEGKKLFVSNYGDGTFSVFNVKNGILGKAALFAHKGQGPDKTRQKGPHVHCIQPEPGGRRLFVIDLGIDRVVFYNLADMSEAGSYPFRGGSGPRHLVFSGSGQKKTEPIFAWAVCEMSSEIYAFDPKSGKTIGVYSTLPNDFSGHSTCAAIKLSADGRFLYASNRGHDSVACFETDSAAGSLSLLSVCPVNGCNPRDIAISPDGSFLYAVNQDSDTINIFKLENGLPLETGLSLEIPSPACMVF